MVSYHGVMTYVKHFFKKILKMTSKPLKHWKLFYLIPGTGYKIGRKKRKEPKEKTQELY